MREIIGNTIATPNPRSDWNQNDATKADYIKNKPTVLTEDEIINLIEEKGGDVGVQADWNQTDDTQLDYIKNKPTIPTKTSELTNDSGYLTVAPEEIYIGNGDMPETATIQILMDGESEEQALKDELKDYIDVELQIAKNNGEFDGADGKSAYAYAQDGGYVGTEVEFAEKMAFNIRDCDNVVIGKGAGDSLTTGKRCIAIGVEADLEASVDDQLNIGNLLQGSLDTNAAHLLLNGGLRLPIIPTAFTSNDHEVWNNGGVLMVGNGGMETIVQAVISALPVYNGEVE